jgi:hypothetical protein
MEKEEVGRVRRSLMRLDMDEVKEHLVKGILTMHAALMCP